MKLIKSFLLIGLLSVVLTSCSKDEEVPFSKSGIAMTGAQEVPAVTTTGSGSLDVVYSRAARTLYYKVTWTGLSGNATGMHIHGIAGSGANAGVFQAFSGFTAAASGTFSGSLYIDGIAIKEEDLLNGRYYVNIHTATFPGGEVRGQITFN
jgi:hypothetical protein